MIIKNKGEFLLKISSLSIFRALGMDYGLTKIGFSIYYSKFKIVIPLATFLKRDNFFKNFNNLIYKYKINALIISKSVKTTKSLIQIKELEIFVKYYLKCNNLPIIYSNEEYTTFLASDLLQQFHLKRLDRNVHTDLVSSFVLLNNFFNLL